MTELNKRDHHCGVCRFWQRTEAGITEHGPERGLCRFEPPKLLRVCDGADLRDLQTSDFGWPQTLLGEWCGKFEERT